MAGPIQEIINNKFYFVLDEVGASDGESESDPKKASNGANNSCSLKINTQSQTNQGTILLDDDDDDKDETENQTLHLPCPTFHDKEKSCISKNNADANEMEEKKNKDDVKMCNSLLRTVTVLDLTSEGTTEVVDMDIESGEESENQSAKKIEPIVRVTFQNESIEKILKPALMNFFKQNIEDCTVICSYKDRLQLEVYDEPVKLENDLLSFNLDTTPTQGNYSEVPQYGKTHDFILSDKTLKENENKNFAMGKMACFNCLQSHNLRDCKEIKDFRTINKNRLKFKQLMKTTKTSRYHLDEGQKFNAIVPGAISRKLRHALNLHSYQQPSFIYRMRLLGYPPAWLEEAKVSHSGVTMYDSTGIPVLEEDEEEGEIIPEGAKDKFDISKIIEFPGFNVPLPSNFKDEAKLYGCPDISDKQSKQTLINMLKPKTVQAYKKKSLAITKLDNQPQECLKRKSPTIEEMEEKKRQLLMELDVESSSSASRLNFEDSSSGAGTEKELPETPDMKIPGTVRNSEFGTPILKSVSPFSKLPSREKFSVDVSEILNFENLPNSTGKYETMRHVITKIRVSASKSQSNP